MVYKYNLICYEKEMMGIFLREEVFLEVYMEVYMVGGKEMILCPSW
jgi:hypothetical protein